MGMREVEEEAERLYENLHNRQHVGFVNGFRSARLTLRAGGEEALRQEVADYHPAARFAVPELGLPPIPPDQYDVGFRAGMERALLMFGGT